MSRIYDLHCHSDQSDGILSPEALVSRAKRQDVDVLALTDHDTIDGIARAQQQAQSESIDLIPGIEFSTQWQGRNIHIVGLNIDPQHPDLLKTIDAQHTSRRHRAEVIADKLAHIGIDGALEGAQSMASHDVVGRPHFAKFLVQAGHCKNIAQAFKKYLGTGKLGDVKQVWPEFDLILDTIQKAGGVAVIAHPDKYNMTRTKLCAMVGHFKALGGKAIEVISGAQANNVTRDIGVIARKYGLLASCGSDFHVPDQPWQELGRIPSLPDDLEPVWSFWE